MKKLAVLLVLVAAAAIGWTVLRKGRPPSVSFARVRRQPLVSSIPTNGKTEPFEWQAARAEDIVTVHKEGLAKPQGRLRQLSDSRVCELAAKVRIAMGCAP